MTEIYMEKRAFEFFRSFPDVPEALRPVFSRFYDVGLLWVDPNVDSDGFWPGQLRWSDTGMALQDSYGENFPSGSVNFFTVEQITPFLPNGDLGDLERRIFKDEIPGMIPAMGHPKSPKRGGLRQAMAGLDMALDGLVAAMKTNRGKIGR